MAVGAEEAKRIADRKLSQGELISLFVKFWNLFTNELSELESDFEWVLQYSFIGKKNKKCH